MTAPLLAVRDLSVVFDVPRPGAWPWTPPRKLHAVGGASFSICHRRMPGDRWRIGLGQITLARAIVGTLPATAGQILFDRSGSDRNGCGDRGGPNAGMCRWCSRIRWRALNPRMPVGDIIAEPLITHQPGLARDEVRARVQALMERCACCRI